MSMCFMFGLNTLVIVRGVIQQQDTGWGAKLPQLRVNDRVMIIVSTIKHQVARCFGGRASWW